MKKSILVLVVVFVFVSMRAQRDWRQMMQDTNANFYTIQKAANAYFKKQFKKDNDREEKESEEEEVGGYEQYKRWEAFMEPRVYPTGKLYLASQTWQNYQDFLNQNISAKAGNNMIASSTWTAMGPFGAMTGSACGLPRKAGRDNFITFHPSITTTYWVGAPAGGLWKTTNDGASWTTATDNLGVIGCSDLAIDPTNPNTMYLATGDGEAGDTYCIGVLKSTDGGNTWNTTGLTWTVNQQRLMRRLIINPNNPQILIAASSAGIWRTTNGGTNWTQVSTINAYDLEFKPTNPNVVYAGGGASGTTHGLYLSTNGGASFALISNGIPTTGCTRVSVAVTPADTNYVYVLRSNTTYGYGGLYRSVVGGTLFVSMSTTPDLIANSCAGTTSGNGQGWYDLALAASPLNKDEVVVGGVNHWQSTNGGGTWTNIGCWNSTGLNPSYVHADVHEVQYNSAGTLFSCNDGGVYKYNGSTWADISSPMNIAEQYRIGLSGTTADYWITGHQDNGTNVYNGSTYAAKYCGDGMDCFIDRTNNNNMFGSTPQGGFILSTNAGTTWSSAQTGMSGTAPWVAPWHQDPVTANTLYAGRSQMFVSTNLGASWTQLTATGGSGTIVDFAIAPSNNQVLYVIHGTGVFKTTNAGASWTNVTAGLSGSPTYVAIDPTDPNNAWVTISGYTAGTKVFVTTNGGTNWTNVSSNLPNLPANCIVYEPGTLDRVYVGMDVGVYYKDNSTLNWTLYNTGLPNVPIHDLEISPANPTKLYAATYGRGTYKVDLVVSAPPVSSFSVAASPICSGQAIQFNDISSNSPTTWSWSVTPSAGVVINTAASKNPTISFATGGTYTVSMQASNLVGPGSITSQTVTVVGTPTVTVANNSQTVCAGSPVTYTASGATTYAWTGGGTSAVNTYTPASSTVYTVTGTTSGCSSSKTSSVTVNALPTVTITGLNSICLGGTAILTGSGATTYTWSTAATTTSISVNPTVTTTYSVNGTGANGCKNSSAITLTVNPLPVISTAASSSVICLGQNANLNASGASTYTWMPGSLVGAAVVATPTANTTYTVTGTSAAGCNNTAIRSVSVNPLPVISTTISNSVICAGQTTTLSASGASTYTWNPGSVTGSPVALTPASSIIYTVTGTNANGCNNTAVRSVTVNALPTVAAVAANTMICTGQTTTLTASGALTYTWQPGGATGVSTAVSPTVSSSYSVTGTSAQGCNNLALVTVSVSACTGIEQVVNTGGYSIYPNPTTGKLNIQFNVTKATVINAEVVDALGKVLIKQSLVFSANENTQVINMATLPDGLYFINLTNSDNKSQTIRIVKD